MANEAFARVRGISSSPSVNVREDAGTNFNIRFKATVGMEALAILAAKPDALNNGLNGKTYIWFQLKFDDETTGWIRDDLLEIKGLLTPFGYPDQTDYTFAFQLVQDTVPVVTAPPLAPVVTPPPPTEFEPIITPPISTPPTPPTPPVGSTPVPTVPPIVIPATQRNALQDLERVKKLAFRLTGIFEGRGYAAYQNFDGGIVSYGFIQFTLAAGSLANVVNQYVEASRSPVAEGLRSYQERINGRDPNLRSDSRLRDLLVAAADEPEMQEVQERVATDGYWQTVVDSYITTRGLVLPLSWGLLFDMGVNFGTGHGFVRLAETELGVPTRSRIGENGISEETLITRVAQLRKKSHDAQAIRDNLPGLKQRGDFWVDLITRGDWYLQGQNGKLNVKGQGVDVNP